MTKSSYLQASFLGGEWAPEVQGRSDVDNYKTALNRCLNYFPIEQGSLLRRQGFERLGKSRFGLSATLASFDISGNPVIMEFTNDGGDVWVPGGADIGHVRFWQGKKHLTNGAPVAVASVSTATPAVVTTSTAHGFSTADNVFFTLDYTSGPDAPPSAFCICNREFYITVTGATTFTLKDANSQFSDVDGNSLGWTGPGGGTGTYTVSRIAELVTPYIGQTLAISGQHAECRFVQDEKQIIILHPKYQPRKITQIATSFGFDISTFDFLDGPYLDINETTTTLTPSAVSGSITVTASSVTGINNGAGFLPTDVGRHIRMLNLPAAWDSTSNAYVVGNQVLYTDGNVYTAVKNTNGPADNHGVAAPPTNTDHWALLSSVPSWGWLIITAVTNTTHVTATVQTSTQSYNNSLFNILATTTWQLGLYCDTNGWPACGTFHENRLWLAGTRPLPRSADNWVIGTTYGINTVVRGSDKQFYESRANGNVGNDPISTPTSWNLLPGAPTVPRLDGSMTSKYGTFSPTSDSGEVGDANAVAAIIKTNENNPILWLAPDERGLIFGTLTSEWKVQASALDDPITPSSIQARRLTTHGTSNGYPFNTAGYNGTNDSAGPGLVGTGIEPVNIVGEHVFVQRMQRKLIEIGRSTTDGNGLYSQINTQNLSLTASHLSVGGIAQIAYTANPKPFIWARTSDGRLIGCTYLRQGDKLTAGWHRHDLGKYDSWNTAPLVRSMASGPSIDQLTNHLYLAIRSNEIALDTEIWRLSDIFDDNLDDDEGNFLDGSSVPYGGRIISKANGDAIDGVRFAIGMGTAIGPRTDITVASGNSATTVGGIDLGEGTYYSDGTIEFPFSGAFTLAYLQSFPSPVGPGLSWDPTGLQCPIYDDLTDPMNPVFYVPNVVVGVVYTSQAQMLRPDHGNDAGARNGPAFGKIRRNHWFAAYLNRTQNIKFGTDFADTLHPAKLQTAGGTTISQPTLFSGIITDTISDDYSKLGMISFQQTRPTPGQILAISGYCDLSDK